MLNNLSKMDSENEKSKLLEKYIKQLSEIEKLAMEIAKENLKTSFDIEKSLGFTEWLKNNN